MKKVFLIISLVLMIALVGVHLNMNNGDDDHDHSVEIEGKDMKLLSVQEVADLWEIDSEVLLQDIIQEFDLKGEYTTNSSLEDIREEYKFSPAMIKDMAEEIKQKGAINE